MGPCITFFYDVYKSACINRSNLCCIHITRLTNIYGTRCCDDCLSCEIHNR